MIKSLLVANRGEIACRIIRTARKLGIRTIAVYSRADEKALHVRMADEAHLVGAEAAADSYLRSGRILSVAKQTGADAIHPGYGFLSENADFAELAAEAGMIFVGPSPEAIRSMGLKDKAKQIMENAGVPVVPGYHGTNQTPDFLKRKAYEIGYPVLIKAVAGGGGKGMRKVNKAIEFDDALDAAKREAQSAFGNGAVLIEKFIESPRHIEIQIFGDSHGNVVHLFERDCSLQRRHQKVIEEAPAPGMTESVRAAMGQAACDAAKAVGYQGAGTVEFIVDGAHGLTEDGFYFMEMNTRLQVEHPVTEMITRTDLVEWQLRVANGEALPVSQADLNITGHAVEARIYAEDVPAGFLPSTGKLVTMDLGEQDESVRFDTGVEKGDEITPFYDPMIAKLIAYGTTRDDALDLLQTRLESARIVGPVTNTTFLARLCANRAFRTGWFDTSLIENNLETLVLDRNISDAALCAGVAGLVHKVSRRIASENPQQSPWLAVDGFQTVGVREIDWHYVLDGKDGKSRIRFEKDGIMLQSQSGSWVAASRDVYVADDDDRLCVLENGHQFVFEERQYAATDSSAAANSHGSILVPMHGKIIAVTVSDGDEVEQGDIVFSVEAMKMEHAVVAPIAGRIESVAISVSQQVENGFPAMKITARHSAQQICLPQS